MNKVVEVLVACKQLRCEENIRGVVFAGEAINENRVEIKEENVLYFLKEYAWMFGYYYSPDRYGAEAKIRADDDIQKFKKGDFVTYKKGKYKGKSFMVMHSYYDDYGGEPRTKHQYCLRHNFEDQESAWHNEKDLVLIAK